MESDSILLGAISDDYTGGADLASMLSERGVRTVQVLSLQADELMARLQGYEAVVISLKSRSLPADEACTLSRRALNQLTRLKPRQIHFKYCSTFDSTPMGNIGPVIETLMDALGVGFTIAVPALPVNLRTQYLGHLFVGSQLLSESHMRHHPLTPMTDANLVRHLQTQTRLGVGLIAHPLVRSGAEAIKQECSRLQDEGMAVALVDAICDEDLAQIAEAAIDLSFITGGSGLAMALPAAWTKRGWLSCEPRSRSHSGTSADPVLILSGSCSPVTLRQIQHLRNSGCAAIPLDVCRLISHGPDEEIARLLSEVKAAMNPNVPVMVFSSATIQERERVLRQAAASGFSPERVYALIEQVLAAVARQAVESGQVRRLVVAGGETSGAVMDALKIQAVEVVEVIASGVPSLKSIGGTTLALALKSGNFGGPDFFLEAIRSLREISLPAGGPTL